MAVAVAVAMGPCQDPPPQKKAEEKWNKEKGLEEEREKKKRLEQIIQRIRKTDRQQSKSLEDIKERKTFKSIFYRKRKNKSCKS